MRFLALSIIILLLMACEDEFRHTRLNTVLEASGMNRGELEKVLQYYSSKPKDSLKLRAAEFLIKNMPGHYTLEGELIDKYHDEFQKRSGVSYFTRKMFDLTLKSKREVLLNSVKKEDIFCIKADYLIHHINAAFALRETCSWLQNVPFDVFLEYILPYRLEHENLDFWLDSLKILPEELNEMRYKEDINRSVLDLDRHVHLKMPTAFYDEQLIKNMVYSNCYDEARRDVFLKRAKGIPAAIDFIPYYPHRNGYHHWETIVSSGVKYIKNVHLKKVAKVYRRTFSRNDIVQPIGDEYIPEFFLDPFNRDVTDSYVDAMDVNVKVEIPQIHHVYLCVFCNLKWEPIAVTNVKKGSALFKNMGKGVVYLPAYYNNKELCALEVPFILSLSGNRIYCSPDTNKRMELHLTRKYPFNKDIYKFSKELEGTVVIASNNKEFIQADTVGVLSTENMHYFNLNVTCDKRYRYWKIVAREFTSLNIADIVFEDSLQKPISCFRIDSKFEKGFDRDPLTSITISGRWATLPVDFGKSIQVSRVIATPRGDGNGIYPDNFYELFYWDNNKWKSLKREIATDYCLDYNNIPRNALLWLRNFTTGEQERIFTWDGEEILYW